MDVSQLKDDRKSSSETEERVEKLKNRKIKKKAVQRFLEDRDIELSNVSGTLFRNVANSLDEDQFQNLLDQYRYAGQQTLNYYVISGIEAMSNEKIEVSISDHFQSRDEVEGEVKEPYFVQSDEMNNRYYAIFGYFTDHGEVDPETGARTKSLGNNRAILAIKDDSDLVEVRSSSRSIANSIKEELLECLQDGNSDSVYKPPFGPDFQKEFNKLVEKYTSLKVRTRNEEGSTVSNIRFTAGKDEQGNREDAREDSRVSRELDEEGSTITHGYARLDQNLKFNINRTQSKVSLQKFEMEDLLNEITELIDDVLEQTGGYPQRTLREINNVPE